MELITLLLILLREQVSLLPMVPDQLLLPTMVLLLSLEQPIKSMFQELLALSLSPCRKALIPARHLALLLSLLATALTSLFSVPAIPVLLLLARLLPEEHILFP